MKRFLLILITLIILIGVGVFIYFYFFANKATVVVAPPGTTTLPISGNNGTTQSGGGNKNPNSSASSIPVSVAPRLVEINAGPVVNGEVVLDVSIKNATTSASTTPVISSDVIAKYIERESGNVFSYSVKDNKNTRVSNKTLPGIQSATWLPNGLTAFVRYLSGNDFSTINTYAFMADGSNGFFLQQNLSSIDISSTSVLMLASGVNGSSASLANTDGTKASNVFTTPLSQLRVSFAGKKYLAYTKPSSGIDGYAFIVDSTGHFSRIAGPRSGLTALASPSGAWVLLSYPLNNDLQMELVNTSTGEIVSLPVATIADKCVWTNDESSIYCGIPTNVSSDASYPDDWYQGAFQFSDRIWKIDVSGRFAQLTLDFSSATNGVSLDAVALSVDQNNTELVFMNKNDNSLWGYQL